MCFGQGGYVPCECFDAISGTLTGDLTIDTVTGAFLGGNLLYAGQGSQFRFDSISSQSANEVFLTDAEHDYLLLSFPVDNLIGYAGGALCDGFYDGFLPCTSDFQPANLLQYNGVSLSGTVTLASRAAATPEPASAFLVGMGLLELARRRRRT